MNAHPGSSRDRDEMGWPVGTDVRIVKGAHLVRSVERATHVVLDPSLPVPADTLRAARTLGKHIVAFSWVLESCANDNSEAEHFHQVVGAELSRAKVADRARQLQMSRPRIGLPALVGAKPFGADAIQGLAAPKRGHARSINVDDGPRVRPRLEQDKQAAPKPVVIDISDSEDEAEPVPRAALQPRPPRPVAVRESVVGLLGRIDPADRPSREGSLATFSALLARETLGRPFFPNDSRLHRARLRNRRMYGGEDCYALARSFNLDDPMFDLPDVPSALGRRAHAEGALHHAWTLMEIRFVVHLEARRNPKKISKQDRLDESEACLKMFIAAFPDRPLISVREKIVKSGALPEFYGKAAALERSRGPLRPLSIPSMKTRSKLTDEENQCLADLFFRMWDRIELSPFIVEALELLPQRRISELDYAWRETTTVVRRAIARDANAV